MAGKRHPACEWCGRTFRPDPRNEHRQKYCTRPDCRSERARARKRRSYRKRLEREAGFRESERKRCGEAMRRSRAERKRAEKENREAACARAVPPAGTVLAGMVSHLADTTDPHEVAGVMNALADRGRAVTMAAGNGGAP